MRAGAVPHRAKLLSESPLEHNVSPQLQSYTDWKIYQDEFESVTAPAKCNK